MSQISMDEWRSALEDAGVIGDGDAGHTAAELAVEMGIAPRRMRKLLAAGVLENKYVRGTGYRDNKFGARHPVPVYTLIEKTK